MILVVFFSQLFTLERVDDYYGGFSRFKDPIKWSTFSSVATTATLLFLTTHGHVFIQYYMYSFILILMPQLSAALPATFTKLCFLAGVNNRQVEFSKLSMIVLYFSVFLPPKSGLRDQIYAEIPAVFSKFELYKRVLVLQRKHKPPVSCFWHFSFSNQFSCG